MNKTDDTERKKLQSKQLFVRICLILGALYFLLMIGVTVYAQTIYVQQLPEMRLDNPVVAEIDYILMDEAEITEDGAVIMLDLSNKLFPTRILTPGCSAELIVDGATYSGVLSEVIEHPNYLYEIILSVDTNLPSGTMVDTEIICAVEEFQNTVDRSLITQNYEGTEVIYLVAQQDGPWGKQYVLTEEPVNYWPEDGSDIVALMLLDSLEYPIAIPVDSDLFLYTGMEVQLVS